MLSDTITGQGEGRGPLSINEADVLDALKEKGVVDDVMKQLHFDSRGSGAHISASSKPATHFINKDEKYALNLAKKGI